MKTPSLGIIKLLLTTSVAVLLGSGAHAQVLTPLSVTGFNRDIVVASSESGPPYSSTQTFDPGGWTWYELGQNTGAPATGLSTGAITSESDPNITLQFASFTGNNALYLSDGQTGTLTLAAPTTLTSLAVFGATAFGSGTNAVVLNLQGGGTLSLGGATNSGQDWFFGGSVAVTAGGRIDPVTGDYQTFDGNPRIYQDVFTFSAVTVESISFTYDETSGFGNSQNALMAISGEVVPEPSTVAFLALGGVGLLTMSARRRSVARA